MKKLRMSLTWFVPFVFGLLFIVTIGNTQILTDSVPELNNIDVDEHLGQFIPMDLSFVNSAGQEESLSDYFYQGKPVVLVLAYYNCPMLCTLVLNGLTQTIYSSKLVLGDQYQVLTISIDPAETADLAAAKKRAHLQMLDKNAADPGWEFFVGKESQIRALADSVGFKYFYVEESEEFAHPAVVMLLTEQGKISRYLYGIEFNPRDFKLGILEASQGRVGSTIDRILLYCYHYDPEAKGYVVFAGNVMKLGGVLTLVLMAAFLGAMWMKEQRKKTPAISKN